MNKIESLAGEKFGSLVVENDFKRVNNKTYWLCKCDCGEKEWVQRSNLLSGSKLRCKKCRYKLANSKCEHCNTHLYPHYNYCPICGSKVKN